MSHSEKIPKVRGYDEHGDICSVGDDTHPKTIFFIPMFPTAQLNRLEERVFFGTVTHVYVVTSSQKLPLCRFKCTHNAS